MSEADDILLGDPEPWYSDEEQKAYERKSEMWLPDELKKARLELGENQSDFGARFGVETPTAVSFWENGRRDMPTHVASWLAQRLIHKEVSKAVVNELEALYLSYINEFGWDAEDDGLLLLKYRIDHYKHPNEHWLEGHGWVKKEIEE